MTTRLPHETELQFEARARHELSVQRYGRDRTDAQEKAVFTIRDRARAAFAANPGKSLDQHYVEAVQEEMRRDPRLAQEWKESPGKFSSN